MGRFLIPEILILSFFWTCDPDFNFSSRAHLGAVVIDQLPRAVDRCAKF